MKKSPTLSSVCGAPKGGFERAIRRNRILGRLADELTRASFRKQERKMAVLKSRIARTKGTSQAVF